MLSCLGLPLDTNNSMPYYVTVVNITIVNIIIFLPHI